MATYLIDYENVHYHGLKGIETLSKDDVVIIFLGQQNTKMLVDVSILLSQSKATILWKKAKRIATNYLDMQIATYLGVLIAKKESKNFYVISKDRGFLALIDFYSENLPSIKVTLQQTISGRLFSDVAKEPILQSPHIEKEKATIPKKPALSAVTSINYLIEDFAALH